MESRRVANCVFCEDIRAEIGNKISLMGVFASDVLITAPPPITVKLGVVIWIVSDLNDNLKKYKVRILVPPERSEIMHVDVEGEMVPTTPPDEYSQHLTLRIVMSLPQVVLQEDGFIEAMVEPEGEGPLRAGRLQIKFNVDPAAAGLPIIPA